MSRLEKTEAQRPKVTNYCGWLGNPTQDFWCTSPMSELPFNIFFFSFSFKFLIKTGPFVLWLNKKSILENCVSISCQKSWFIHWEEVVYVLSGIWNQAYLDVITTHCFGEDEYQPMKLWGSWKGTLETQLSMASRKPSLNTDKSFLFMDSQVHAYFRHITASMVVVWLVFPFFWSLWLVV